MNGRSTIERSTIERSTIVGIATGTPDGGVAIVRISGPRAQAIASSMGTGRLPPRGLVRRPLHVGDGREDALVVMMPQPASFTGEDVVELHVHAGLRNVQRVVAQCVAAGCVAAGPGDFSRRAFENGRMSLDQAEGIAALIGAETDAALEQARRLVAGELGRDVDALCERIAELRAELEAGLDFPDDVEGIGAAGAEGPPQWVAELEAIAGVLRDWRSRYDAGARARARPRVVLAGPPNAGKSSLFNALVGHARTIVSSQPGTTRDYVEAELALGDHACVLVDTAGLREVTDVAERAGIERSHDQIEGADLVLWLEASDAGPASLPTVAFDVQCVETKRDLGAARPTWRGVSSSDPDAVEALRRWLRVRLVGEAGAGWIGLLRHRGRTEAALSELDAARGCARSPELAAFHLGAAHDRLAEIRGRTALGPVGEDVMRRVFERFCIGK